MVECSMSVTTLHLTLDCFQTTICAKVFRKRSNTLSKVTCAGTFYAHVFLQLDSSRLVIFSVSN